MSTNVKAIIDICPRRAQQRQRHSEIRLGIRDAPPRATTGHFGMRNYAADFNCPELRFFETRMALILSRCTVVRLSANRIRGRVVSRRRARRNASMKKTAPPQTLANVRDTTMTKIGATQGPKSVAELLT